MAVAFRATRYQAFEEPSGVEDRQITEFEAWLPLFSTFSILVLRRDANPVGMTGGLFVSADSWSFQCGLTKLTRFYLGYESLMSQLRTATQSLMDFRAPPYYCISILSRSDPYPGPQICCMLCRVLVVVKVRHHGRGTLHFNPSNT